MKGNKSNGKLKKFQEKENAFKPIKKVPTKTSKVNFKSSKFWDEVYEDVPDIEDLKNKTT